MALHDRPHLSYLLAPAMRGPVEVSLRALLESYNLSADVDLLNSTLMISAALNEFGLVAEPPLGVAGLDAACVVRPSNHPAALGLAQAAIAAGEGPQVEFKSTLLLSVNSWEKDPQPPLNECRCDKVAKSCLKTVASYLNTRGGTLLVGIRDNGQWFGLENDMKLADPRKQDFDGWELEFRKLIDKNFISKSINSYVLIEKLEYEGKVAARVEVAERSNITFTRFGGKEEIYIRSGNRSVPIDFLEVEQYFSMNRLYV